MLHTNEQPLMHLMKDQGMETTGANSFTEELGHLITGEVHLDEFYHKLEFGKELRNILEEIIAAKCCIQINNFKHLFASYLSYQKYKSTIFSV